MYLIAFGQGIAFLGFLLSIFWYFLPAKWGEFLDSQNGRFGILLSGVLAIFFGFVLATLGYYGG